MSNRAWFYASNGQQQGPYPEDQLRDLIARGTVRADTLVWTDGMAGWQKAAEVPGLMSGGSAPPAILQPGGQPMNNGRYGDHGGGPVSIDFGIWEFTWRSLLLLVGTLLIIPAPWALVMYSRWIVSVTRVPGRPNLSFTGRTLTIAGWFFGAIVLAIVTSFLGSQILNIIEALLQFALYWLFIRWFIANIASDGQPIGLTFSGTVWAYFGWNILAVLSFFTIVGWAWVYVAQLRWFCRNIQGSRREVIFNGTGLEFLWRSIVAGVASLFIIPIPWVYRWLMQWMASQTELVAHDSTLGA